MKNILTPPPEGPGAYLWYYADFTSEGRTAVVIFMIGNPFSPSYVRAGKRGGVPQQHSAVNFALYGLKGERIWALSEYPNVRAAADGLEIGHSRFQWLPEGLVRFEIRERSMPWRRRVEAVLELTPEVPMGDPVTLVPGLSHRWQPLAARARANLRIRGAGATGETWSGSGYFDTNRGDEPLGTSLTGWEWSRVHGAERTFIRYSVPSQPTLEVSAKAGQIEYTRMPPVGSAPSQLTRWGLRVPHSLAGGRHRLERPRLLESSPFYARLEAHRSGVHAIGEVANFRRFRSPLFRWMAHFRTRHP